MNSSHSYLYQKHHHPEGGGDYPANEYIIGSGSNALLCRYQAEKRNLSEKDQLSLEWAGTYKHYHSAMFRTIPIGKADPKHIKMHEACVEALNNCVNNLVPGKTAGDVFDTHAKYCIHFFHSYPHDLIEKTY